MKATPILAGQGLLSFECWITNKAGIVRRIAIDARDQESALALCFCLHPDSVAVSCRQADRGAPRDALAELQRRAEDDRGSP
jgi:hypothetical protein